MNASKDMSTNYACTVKVVALCVMSYDCTGHENATTSCLILVFVTDSEDSSQLDLCACACSNYGRAVMVIIFKQLR